MDPPRHRRLRPQRGPRTAARCRGATAASSCRTSTAWASEPWRRAGAADRSRSSSRRSSATRSPRPARAAARPRRRRDRSHARAVSRRRRAVSGGKRAHPAVAAVSGLRENAAGAAGLPRRRFSEPTALRRGGLDAAGADGRGRANHRSPVRAAGDVSHHGADAPDAINGLGLFKRRDLGRPKTRPLLRRNPRQRGSDRRQSPAGGRTASVVDDSGGNRQRLRLPCRLSRGAHDQGGGTGARGNCETAESAR